MNDKDIIRNNALGDRDYPVATQVAKFCLEYLPLFPQDLYRTVNG